MGLLMSNMTVVMEINSAERGTSRMQSIKQQLWAYFCNYKCYSNAYVTHCCT